MGEEVEIIKLARDVPCLHCGHPETYFQHRVIAGEIDQDTPPVLGCTSCKLVAKDVILHLIAEHLQHSLELDDGPVSSFTHKGAVIDGKMYLRGDIDLEVLAEDVATIAVWLSSEYPEWLSEIYDVLQRKEA